MKNPAEQLVVHKFTQSPVIICDILEEDLSMESLRKEPSFSRTNWDEAIKIAGPKTLYLLEKIKRFLSFGRRFTLVDVQIQFLKKGQFTTNKGGTSWHLDGATSVHPKLAKFINPNQIEEKVMLDIDDTLNRTRKMKFFSFFLGDVSKTEYISSPLEIEMPKCISSLNIMSDLVEKRMDKIIFQQEPKQVIQFDDTVLHRAVAANCDGWRYWIRIGEIDFMPPPRDRHIDTVYASSVE